MNCREVPVEFACEAETLVGIFSLPERPQGIGVVIVVGGPQYRAGSHRQFVLLARRLAAEGFTVLRFDLRGMGDSSGAQTPFESTATDIAAALGAFERRHPQPAGYVLWGLCDGASAALLYLDTARDRRVRSLCLVNPWVRADETLARTHLKHYYLQRLAEREFWLKLLRGGVGLGALRELGRKLRLGFARTGTREEGGPAYVARMARACLAFSGPVLVALSDDDITAREFDELSGASPTWRRALGREGVERFDVAGADHTFSSAAARQRLEDRTVALLNRTRASAP